VKHDVIVQLIYVSSRDVIRRRRDVIIELTDHTTQKGKKGKGENL